MLSRKKPIMDDVCYGHYNELVQACLAYIEGEIGRGLFEETINRVLVFIRDGMRQFNAIELPPELIKTFAPDMKKAVKGFLLFEEGVEKMRRAVDDEEKKQEILWQGIGLAKFGCDLLNEVLKSQEKFLDDNGES